MTNKDYIKEQIKETAQREVNYLNDYLKQLNKITFKTKKNGDPFDNLIRNIEACGLTIKKCPFTDGVDIGKHIYLRGATIEELKADLEKQKEQTKKTIEKYLKEIEDAEELAIKVNEFQSLIKEHCYLIRRKIKEMIY